MNNQQPSSHRSSGSYYQDSRYQSYSSIGNAIAMHAQPKSPVDTFRSTYSNDGGASKRSELLNTDDPVVMHLLAETAIGDSLGFQILPFEEVERLKKELSQLSSRINGSKRKLALEVKLREAASSLNRLYDDDSGGRDDDGEFSASTKRCEELSQELRKLEQKANGMRQRILEHTARVLQLTHKGLKKKKKNGMDGEDDDEATHTADVFDARSLYMTVEDLDIVGRGQRNGGTAGDTSEVKAKLDELDRRLRGMGLPLNTARQVESQNPYSSLENTIGDLEKQITGLVEQKTILNTQIQQQRELNSKSDSARDTHVTDLTSEISRLQEEIDESRVEHADTNAQLEAVLNQLETLKEQKQSGGSDREARLKAEEEIAARDRQIGNLETSLEEIEMQKDQELQAALQGKVKAEKDAKQFQQEQQDLESEMVRIQTELTMVKAELDGAYGSRAERAKEAAANPAIQREIDELKERNMDLVAEMANLKGERGGPASSEAQERIKLLEKELRDTISDYEEMTKSSIEFEKERDKLEGTIDSYRDRCDNLESQLNDEKIQNLGSGQAARASRDGGTTSTMVLKNEFKKIMRESRAESMKALKAEQEERRRLESLLRDLKREQTANKSNLSQSSAAS